jgi:hypothetical protein
MLSKTASKQAKVVERSTSLFEVTALDSNVAKLEKAFETDSV